MEQNNKKEARRAKREYYENQKDTWEKRAVKACHRYVHLRDSGKPCVSCGNSNAGQYHAGHYRPSGVNSALRYDADRNIHLQCAQCNLFRSGNLSNYRAELVRRLGEETVEWLDNNHEVKRWTIEELKEVVKYYKEKIASIAKTDEPPAKS